MNTVMNADIIIDEDNGKSCISLFFKNATQVNDMVLTLIDRGFIFNYGPRYKDGLYEACILCGDDQNIKIITKGVEIDEKKL